MDHYLLSTSLGNLQAQFDASGALTQLSFVDDPVEPPLKELPERFLPLQQQVREYLAGTRRYFDWPLAAQGTPFQQQVWGELRRIPYGQTLSYAELAEKIGNPSAVRAVAAANGANPICLIIPCHRVIGSDGSLTGYAYGLPMKRQLLELEGALNTGQNSLFPLTF